MLFDYEPSGCASTTECREKLHGFRRLKFYLNGHHTESIQRVAGTSPGGGQLFPSGDVSR